MGDNLNKIIYTEKNNDEATVDLITYTNQQLIAYLYRVFWLTNLDEDPFQYIQFFVPGYPTSLLTIPALRQNIPNAIDLVASTCLNWSTIGQVRTDDPVRQSSHSLIVRSPEQAADSGDNGNSANSC
jgi:hypothetical protein